MSIDRNASLCFALVSISKGTKLKHNLAESNLIKTLTFSAYYSYLLHLRSRGLQIPQLIQISQSIVPSQQLYLVLVRQMIGGQETAKYSNCRLEQVDVLVDPELQLRPDPLASLVELVLQPHDEHRVQRVDDRQAEAEPVLGRFRNRSESLENGELCLLGFAGFVFKRILA